MPHQFKLSPDHPAIGYLVRLHADLGGKIWENRKEAERLAAAEQFAKANGEITAASRTAVTAGSESGWTE